MSEQALGYYGKFARQYKVELPPDLTGRPVPLQRPGQRISVHGSEAQQQRGIDLLEAGHGGVVARVSSYLLRLARKQHPGLRELSMSSLRGKEHEVAEGVVRRLMPSLKGFSTGYLDDAQLEAIPPAALSPEIATYFAEERKKYGHGQPWPYGRPTIDGGEVYLLTSARLSAGRKSLGRMATITALFAEYGVLPSGKPDYLLDKPYTMGVRLRTNNLVARSGLHESRAIATILAAHEARNPAQGGAPGLGKRS